MCHCSKSSTLPRSKYESVHVNHTISNHEVTNSLLLSKTVHCLCKLPLKIWQYVLGSKGADLGGSGPKGDGIDGVFGPRTLAASMRFYGKTTVPKDLVLAEKSRVDEMVARRAEKIKPNKAKG